jgi:hypothetical protein
MTWKLKLYLLPITYRHRHITSTRSKWDNQKFSQRTIAMKERGGSPFFSISVKSLHNVAEQYHGNGKQLSNG